MHFLPAWLFKLITPTSLSKEQILRAHEVPFFHFPECLVKASGLHWLSVGVVLTGILLRCLYLDTDPRYYDWVGYITDEGRWIQGARNLALHGHVEVSSGMNFHLSMAPLFQLSNYLVFELLGVSLWTSRLFTALFGSAILVLFWRCLHRAVNSQALLVGVALLALQSDLIALSRVAVPEMVVMSFELAVYFLIVSGTSPWQMVSAGALFLVACGMKATAALLLPVFSVVILVMPRSATDPRRWCDLMLFLLGFLVPGLIGAATGYFLLSGPMPNHIGELATLIHGFLGISKPYLYNMISFLFEHPLSYTINLWSLGVWLTTVVWWASGPNKIDSYLHRYLTTSGIWFLLYFLLMLNLGYFPTRYKIHVLMPMALFITFGVSLIQKVGLEAVFLSAAEPKGRLSILWLSILSFPTAAFFSPLLMFVIALLGVDSQRLSAKLACFLFSLVTITCLAHYVKGNRRAVSFFLVFPLVEGMVWFVLPMLESAPSFWPTTGFGVHAGYLSLGILIAVTTSWVLSEDIVQWRPTEGSRVITALAICCVAVSLVRIVPGYFDRHYSIRDSSQDLGRIVPASARISTFRAETLFNNNNLHYSSVRIGTWSSEKPDFLLVAFNIPQIQGILESKYNLIKSYDLWVSPEYDYSGSNSVGHARESVIVGLYKIKQTAKP